MATESGETNPAEDEDFEGAPWHFKLLLVALVLYLGFRLIQLLVWLIEKVV